MSAFLFKHPGEETSKCQALRMRPDEVHSKSSQTDGNMLLRNKLMRTSPHEPNGAYSSSVTSLGGSLSVRRSAVAAERRQQHSSEAAVLNQLRTNI
ncbi:hypothetical protein NQZ68_001433 [Dissostichus eleginoides]|nr:hypothetical protein NQZ68_001433 [Dissostichus eleginoides]